MPYIEVETLPEGVEEADVVSRADYDSVIQERDSTIQQRDDALTRIEEAEKEVRETKARYADAILSANQHRQTEQRHEEKHPEPKLTMSTSDLFRED